MRCLRLLVFVYFWLRSCELYASTQALQRRHPPCSVFTLFTCNLHIETNKLPANQRSALRRRVQSECRITKAEFGIYICVRFKVFAITDTSALCVFWTWRYIRHCTYYLIVCCPA